MLADKAYDSDSLRAQLEKLGSDAVMPFKANRTAPGTLTELYKARSEIECTFNLLKQARRSQRATKKTLRNYAAVAALSANKDAQPKRQRQYELPKRNVGNHVNQQANLLAGRSATVLDGSNVHGRVLAGAPGAGAPTLTGPLRRR